MTSEDGSRWTKVSAMLRAGKNPVRITRRRKPPIPSEPHTNATQGPPRHEHDASYALTTAVPLKSLLTKGDGSLGTVSTDAVFLTSR